LTTAPPANRVVWITDRSGKEARQLTKPGVTVGTGLTLTSLDWSADGESLAVTVYPTPFSGDSDLGRSVLLDVKTGDLTWVTDGQTGESSPTLDPTSQRVAYVYPRAGVPANVSEVYVRDLQSGVDESWTRALDRHIWDYRWLGDGSLVVIASDELRDGCWRVTGAGSWRPVPLGEVNRVSGFDLSRDGAMLFAGAEIDRPDELYFKPSAVADPIRITSFNQFIADRKQGEREGFVWESTNGFQPNGVITYPPDFDPGSEYPLVVLIHGGPTASDVLLFDPRAQLMAAKGWVVFQPNYRGSDNLGNAFQSAIADDASEGPGEDVTSGVRALQKKPYIDADAVAVSGWSYGGWMTAWLIGRYPEVWTAAVAGAAPVDFTDMYSLSDLNRIRRHAITDSPYVGDNLEKAYKQSPIIHFPRLRAPTLVLSVTGDYRVTVTGSYKLFSALRDNGVPAEFIAYPGRGHFPSDPVQRQDVVIRWLGWLEKYLRGAQRHP
jgi:dipeptidyl aminopeptidase/acylaminoacyl peptidase